MKRKFILFSAFFWFYLFSFAQETDHSEMIQSKPTSASTTYHDYRLRKSLPIYSLQKIEKMISKLKPAFVEEGGEEGIDDYYKSLVEKDFLKLQTKEKFTYTMINPEYMSQVCAEEIYISDEENKIFGYLPQTLDEATWSERQRDFLKTNRKEVIALIKESALKDQYIGINYKMVLEQVNAIGTIPFLIDFYKTKDKKDKDILTLLVILVKNNKYYPFTRSNLFRDLYGGDKSVYDSYIDYSLANEEYIIKTATNFYAQYPKSKM